MSKIIIYFMACAYLLLLGIILSPSIRDLIIQIGGFVILIKKSPHTGDYFIGTCTLLGASLVIIAARIQARGLKQKIDYEQNKDMRRENMEYLGWLTLSVNDIWRQHLDNEGKRMSFLIAIQNDKHFNNQKTVDTINFLKNLLPETFDVNDQSRHLYNKLPARISDFLNEQPDPFKRLTTGLHSLINAIKVRAIGLGATDQQIETLINEISEEWKKLVDKETDGINLATPHINAMRAKMETNGTVLPYD